MIRLYNTMSGEKEDFMTLRPNLVRMYVCGITAYDFCHLGHARSAIVFDIIKRYLRYWGYRVIHVRNITDIDDKIIARAREEGVTTDAIAKRYVDAYDSDMAMLGVEHADIEPRATDHVEEMIGVIRRLIEKGYAYPVDGDVFFEVKRSSGYGKLSKRNPEELLSGARVEVDNRKRSPLDFVLWKSAKPDEPSWDSPWGKGRPGWHLECTAMSVKYLGECFDIHGGGADLIFPHHENEIAQSEALSDLPFVKYWMHNGFITVDKEKMSKSLGNFFTIKEILQKYDPEVVKCFLLSAHYRSPIEYSDSHLNEAEILLDRYYATAMRIQDFTGDAPNDDRTREGEVLLHMCMLVKERFHKAMSDDFNTAQALGHIFELLKEINRYLDSGPSGATAQGCLGKAKDVVDEMGGVLNIFNRSPEEWYCSLKKLRKIPLSDEGLSTKIEERRMARKRRDWATADSIRKELEDMGIIIEDKRGRTRWRIRTGCS